MSDQYAVLKVYDNNAAQLNAALESAELKDVMNDEVRLFLQTLAVNGIVLAAQHDGSAAGVEKKVKKTRKPRKKKEAAETPSE